ncbi:MAG: hypothetical protein GY765_24225 [bacterium]|nr:hypothetical protein [bacterium]
MKKNEVTKLALNKKTVVNLNQVELNNLRGGVGPTIGTECAQKSAGCLVDFIISLFKKD